MLGVVKCDGPERLDWWQLSFEKCNLVRARTVQWQPVSVVHGERIDRVFRKICTQSDEGDYCSSQIIGAVLARIEHELPAVIFLTVRLLGFGIDHRLRSIDTTV